jgi:hypothetical protein
MVGFYESDYELSGTAKEENFLTNWTIMNG